MTQTTDMLKVQLGGAADSKSRTLLKTFRDGGRAGLSSGLIRRGSRASAEDRTRPQLQVTQFCRYNTGSSVGNPRRPEKDSNLRPTA